MFFFIQTSFFPLNAGDWPIIISLESFLVAKARRNANSYSAKRHKTTARCKRVCHTHTNACNYIWEREAMIEKRESVGNLSVRIALDLRWALQFFFRNNRHGNLSNFIHTECMKSADKM